MVSHMSSLGKHGTAVCRNIISNSGNVISVDTKSAKKCHCNGLKCYGSPSTRLCIQVRLDRVEKMTPCVQPAQFFQQQSDRTMLQCNLQDNSFPALALVQSSVGNNCVAKDTTNKLNRTKTWITSQWN